MEQYAGKILILIGLIAIAIGIILYSGNSGLFSWIGNLPGDIRIEQENFKLYIPITTMLLFSALLTVILWLFS